MANEGNLIPGDKRSLEDRERIGRMGGIASGISKKKNQTFKELAKMMLKMSAPKAIKDKIRETFPELNDDELTARMAMLYAQFGKSLRGDSKAFEVIRDTSGENPLKGLTGAGDINIVNINLTVEQGQKLDKLIVESIGRQSPRELGGLEPNISPDKE